MNSYYLKLISLDMTLIPVAAVVNQVESSALKVFM